MAHHATNAKAISAVADTCQTETGTIRCLLTRIHSSATDTTFKPILKVLRAKKLQVPGSARWKLLITDGEEAMLGVCSEAVSTLFQNKSVVEGTVFKMKDFSVATLSDALKTRVCVVQEIDILHNDDDKPITLGMASGTSPSTDAPG